MAVDALRVQVLFQAIDRLTGPLKGMAGGSKGLQASLSGTRKEILALQRAQGQVGAYKTAEARWRSTNAELQLAKANTAAVKAEIAAAEKPTARLAKALEKAERAEAKAGATHEAHGQKLQGLGRALEAAGVDVAELGRHEEQLAGSLDDANKRLDQQQAKLAKIEATRAKGAKVQAAGDKIAGVGGNMTLGVTLPAIAGAKLASEAANESRAAIAQVEASLASMGPKAGRSLAQLEAQAGKLQSTSLFDDDDILKSVTANLLTFGNVGGKVFDQAQQSALDMSAKLGQDLQSSTMQLGKALNDPKKGVTALQRVGVSFSAEQKRQIEGFVKGGQAAKAQAIILGELQKQFGGSAKKARDADPNAATKEGMRTFSENVGKIVNQVLPKLNSFLEKALNAFNSLSPGMQESVVTAIALAAALGPVLIVVGKLTSGVGLMLPLLARLGPLFLTLGSAMLRAGAMMLANPMVLVIVALVAAVAGAAYLIWRHWDKIKAAFAGGIAWISAAWSRIKGAFAAGIGWFVGLHVRFAQIGAQLIQGLISGIFGKLGALKNTIVNAAKSAANWFKQKLGIRSPSRVFMGFGGHITEGLSRGIAAGEGAAVKRVDRLSSRVAGAFAAGSLVASPAFAAGDKAADGTGPIVATAPIAAGQPGAGQARTAAVASAPMHVEIHIHQLPGQDSAELARLVADKLRKLQGASERSSFADD